MPFWKQFLASIDNMDGFLIYLLGQLIFFYLDIANWGRQLNLRVWFRREVIAAFAKFCVEIKTKSPAKFFLQNPKPLLQTFLYFYPEQTKILAVSPIHINL